MKTPIHILLLEDDPNDATLIKSTLTGADIACEITRVETEAEFVAALVSGGFDLVLSDYSLPAFNGLSAITLVRASWPELPVILVSGTLGEEQAIDSLRNGATDYVLKQRLSRLAPAVRRAMQDVEGRSERRRLEKQVVEAQKMEVIGQLAGGVAHDFNNILSVIMGYSDLILEDLSEDTSLHAYADEIRQASQRGVALTRQLLVFSRKQTVNPVVLDLNQTIIDLDKMLRRLIDENIVMTITLGEPIGCIRADSGHVGQVLMNLVINARDAMPNGGNLTITTSNVRLSDEDVLALPADMPGLNAGAPAQAGDFVMLSVIDTGTGMSDDVKARLFEPFFTTKPKGKGTGLGLPTCLTIVGQAGGHIRVTSIPDQGATFRIYFPRVAQPVGVAVQPRQAAPLARGEETLLLVEDEPSVRHMAAGILKGQGYTVLRASNGQDALHVVREHKGPRIRLVITDVVMPVMGGKVMAEWLKTTYPDLKILFTSGYTEEAVWQSGAPEDGVDFLPKPYSPSALTSKVRAMLDADHAPDPQDTPIP